MTTELISQTLRAVAGALRVIERTPRAGSVPHNCSHMYVRIHARQKRNGKIEFNYYLAFSRKNEKKTRDMRRYDKAQKGAG